MANLNDWKNSTNPKLPPTAGPVWIYGTDSWSWVPRGVKPPIQPGSDQFEYYWKWLQFQKTVPEPYNMVTYRGGLSNNTATYLSDSIYNKIPDLRSETVQMKQQIDAYVKTLQENNLLPSDIYRDKI